MPVELSDWSPASMQEIEALERDLGFSLPAAYRNFLLQHNGARPADNTFAVGEIINARAQERTRAGR